VELPEYRGERGQSDEVVERAHEQGEEYPYRHDRLEPGARPSRRLSPARLLF
jgi:hypothetical protein